MRGSVRKRGNKWAVIIYLGRDKTGKKKQKWYSGYTSKKEADDALADILQDVKKDRIVDHNKLTAKAFFDMWVKDHAEPNLTPSTSDKYRSAAASAAASFGSMAMQKVTPYHIQKWVNEMNESSVSKSTVQTYYNAIKASFNKAISWRIISLSPFRDITRPKVKRQAMRTLTANEVAHLLAAAEGHPMYLVILLAASCGLRRGEILGLKWGRIDLNAQVLQVVESYTESTKGLHLAEPKTESSRRSVNFSDTVKKALLEQKARQMEIITSAPIVDITTLTDNKLKDIHVCTWDDLQPLRPSYATNKFSKLLKEANLPSIRFHDLRHTHATLLLQAGAHPKVVQERLGHSNISITLDTYSHVLPTMQKEAAQLLGF